MEGTGRAGAADATNFMNLGRGFGQNYADLYNQASQDMLGNAIDYASSNADPLIRNAMRNDYRNLMENQLPEQDCQLQQQAIQIPAEEEPGKQF